MNTDNENEFQADLQQDLDAEERNNQDTPEFHFGKIIELTKTLEIQVKDLQGALEDFKGSFFSFDQNGKINL